MKMTGLDPKKLIAAIAVCIIAIALAVYIGQRTFEPIHLPDRANFQKYGPGGPPNPRSMPPGSTPGSAH